MVCCEKRAVNNLKVSKFKTICISAVIRMPLDRKYVTFNALLPYVLKRGCEKYDTLRKINIKMYEMFGAVFDANVIKKGEEQILQFFIETVNQKGSAEKALEFLSEIIMKPLIENNGFIKKYVDDEKENLRAEIRGRKNNKKEYAKLKCIEVMCENEPFGIYGDGYEEDLEKINEKNLYARYLDIINNYGIEFYSVGDLSGEECERYVDEYFNISYKDEPFHNSIHIERKTGDIKEIKEKEGLSQGRLCIGIRANVKPDNDDFYKLLVANEIFGGGASSKLFLKLREENGLCYYINSFIYRFKSIILVQAGIKEKDYKNSVSMVYEAVECMKKGDFKKSDFKNAVSGIVKSYEGIMDYPQGIMDYYLSQNMLGCDSNIENAIEKIKKVSERDVYEIMRNCYIDTIYFLC